MSQEQIITDVDLSAQTEQVFWELVGDRQAGGCLPLDSYLRRVPVEERERARSLFQMSDLLCDAAPKQKSSRRGS
jgi:hypothetical protein